MLLWRQLLAWLQSADGLLLRWASWRVLETRPRLAWLQSQQCKQTVHPIFDSRTYLHQHIAIKCTLTAGYEGSGAGDVHITYTCMHTLCIGTPACYALCAGSRATPAVRASWSGEGVLKSKGAGPPAGGWGTAGKEAGGRLAAGQSSSTRVWVALYYTHTWHREHM
jgi:hypothetical protein